MTGHALLAIVLAAGYGRRMGRPKALLATPDGERFLDRVIRTVKAAGPKVVVAVVGPWWPGPGEVGGAKIVVNTYPDRGPISSILLGLDGAKGDWDGVMVALVDHPGVREDTCLGLAEAHAREPGMIVVPVFGDGPRRRGHPVVFPGWAVDDLRGPEAATGGARTVLKSYPEQVLEVPVDDPAVVMDLDTPQGYRRYLQSE